MSARACPIAVRASRTPAALLLALLAVAALALVAGPGRAEAAQRPCASYPTPGDLAPAHAAVPHDLTARYALLRRPQRAADRVAVAKLGTSLTASGLIRSGIRWLGRVAYGGRAYLVPAEHQLGYKLAPLRCFPPAQRGLERELRPKLEREYRHQALCVVIVGEAGTATCAPAGVSPDALLYTSGTPGFGIVPDGVPDVTVTFQMARPRTLAVHHNFFAIVAPAQSATACGVQWLASDGTVTNVPAGCDYNAAEAQALAGYRTDVAGQLTTLGAQLQTLAGALASGDVTASESAWLSAHETWLGIGQDDGAYGAFGDLGGAIDGLAAGHPLGTADPAFTGFHRVEYDLWTAHDLAAAASDTAGLEANLATLQQTPLTTWLPGTPNGLAGWILRPHEILEDALRDTMTGDDDYGSGTGLDSLLADVQADRELLGLLGPVLDGVAPGLRAKAGAELDALTSVVDATAPAAGAPLPALSTLPVRTRQQIDADLGAAVETLAPVPDLLTSTGKNAPSS